jgi:hypothetical protein
VAPNIAVTAPASINLFILKFILEFSFPLNTFGSGPNSTCLWDAIIQPEVPGINVELLHGLRFRDRFCRLRVRIIPQQN